ncbi:SpoIID/LytB domain-containing protein [Microlunatus flavus]|uniref:SpoIID/LytB domain protein n=1 Tax=Microlunatus flavus TaxID=1036181 RepID=A0A1H9ERS6_9ACTN|nr:SpoIID/LytB domain-containing protein [Microlunatus flavus]SEQ28307.1 SpoIID/LytB domain protein [Microlunatus flavus]
MTRPLLLRPRSLTRAATSLAAAGSLLLTGALSAPTADAADSVKPSGGAFVIKGAGYGHGHGMSQYGAYGAAKKGLSWEEILDFYYPGTTLKTMSSKTTIKVWVTADDDNNVRVMPAAGLKVYDSNDHVLTLPTGTQYRSWRIKRSGSGYRLSWKNADGVYTTYRTSLDTTTWHVATKGKLVKLRMPDGSTREYRGTIQAVKRGAGVRSVNKVKLEDYVRGVVPSEMPTSWAADAVRAQAVAARSYAIRTRDFTSYSGYDICDTTACQVYRGKASTSSGGTRTVRETSGGNAATKATAGTIVTYGGQVALTQFASSNGGAMSNGGYPYLAQKDDPYDGVVKSQAWSRKITAKAVARAYPSVGTVKELKITKRDGSGRWGGRVITIKIVGSKKTLSVTGSGFQSKFGMRSSLYTVTS